MPPASANINKRRCMYETYNYSHYTDGNLVLLAGCLSKKLQEAQEKAQAALNHSTDTIRREAQFRLDEINAEYEEIQRWRYIVSPQDISFYQEKIAPNLFFPGPSFLDIIGGIHDQMLLEIDRYFAKQYNDSQFIARIQQIVKMVLAEQDS